MKKIFNFFSIFLILLGLVSCDSLIKPTDNTINTIGKTEESSDSFTASNTTQSSNITTKLTRQDLSNNLEKIKKLKRTTINETTTIVDKNDKILTSTRKTNVDMDMDYYYSTISGEVNGNLSNKGNVFYYNINDNLKRVEYDNTNDVFKTTGITNILWCIESYKITDNIAKLSITNTNALQEYTVMFNNINYDFDKNYKYNPAYLIITIEFDKENINKITIDASLAFASFYKSVKREITLSDEDFKVNTTETTVSDKFKVSTSSTLDTYVIEMVKEYGDSIYIKSGDFDMLIDAGQKEDGPNVRKMLEQYCEDDRLDVLVATHGHADHIGGFQNGALNSISNVSLIIDYGYSDSSNYDYYYEKYRYNYFSGATYYSAFDCVFGLNGASKVYKFSDDLSLEVINTGQYKETGSVVNSSDSTINENDYSVVIKLTFKEHTYLFTGDLSGDSGDYVNCLKSENLKDITVYKAAHHGAISHYSNPMELLEYLNPEVCVSSAAIIDPDTLTGQYHPTKKFVSNIYKTSRISKNLNYYYNGTMGTIHLSDDGINSIKVNGFGPTRGYYNNGKKVTDENNLTFMNTKMFELLGYYI